MKLAVIGGGSKHGDEIAEHSALPASVLHETGAVPAVTSLAKPGRPLVPDRPRRRQ